MVGGPKVWKCDVIKKISIKSTAIPDLATGCCTNKSSGCYDRASLPANETLSSVWQVFQDKWTSSYIYIHKINELLAVPWEQLAIFSCSREISDATLKASHLMANQIAPASKPHSWGWACEDMRSEGCRSRVPRQATGFCPHQPVKKLCGGWDLLETWTTKCRTFWSNVLHYWLQLTRAQTLQMLLN